MQRLEFSAAEPTRKSQSEESALPLITGREEFLQIVVRIGHRLLAESRKTGNFFNWVLHFQLRKEIVQDDPICIERGSRVKTLRLSPSEETFDVVGCDLAGVRLGGNMLSE